MTIFNDTIGNWTRDLPACSAVPQPTAPPQYVFSDYMHNNFISLILTNKKFCRSPHNFSLRFKMYVRTRPHMLTHTRMHTNTRLPSLNHRNQWTTRDIWNRPTADSTGTFRVAGASTSDVSSCSVFWVCYATRPLRKLATKIFDPFVLILSLCLNIYLSAQTVRTTYFYVGRDSVVGIATRYELDGPGIEYADPSGRAV